MMATLLGVSGAYAVEEGKLDEGLINPGYVEKPEWFKNSFLDLGEDVDEAATDGKRLVLYFFQDGCPYCERLLKVNWRQRDIVDLTRDKFDVVAINMWGDRVVITPDGMEMTEKEFALANRVQYTPTLFFLDEQARLAMRVNGYYPPRKFKSALHYVSEKQETRQRFVDYLAALGNAKGSGQLNIKADYLQPPYRLAERGSDKPLLVSFEQPDCPVCDEVHADAFQRDETRQLLDKFDVAVVDIWSSEMLQTPDGKRMSARDWAELIKVQYTPGLVFFDAHGEEVFRTEAYLRPFHVQSALDYVASGSYRDQSEFQRYLQARADAIEAGGGTSNCGNRRATQIAAIGWRGWVDRPVSAVALKAGMPVVPASSDRPVDSGVPGG